MGKNKPKARIAVRPNVNQAVIRNDDFYLMWYDNLYQLAAATLNWEGMPVEVDKRFVNMALFASGLVVFYWDADYNKYFCLRGVPSGEIDMYNNPLGFTAYGAGNYHKELKASECVPLWLNYRRTNLLPTIDLYAQRLARLERTTDVNLAQQMTPPILECEETQRLTVQAALEKIYEGQPAVVGNTGLASLMQMHYVTADAPYLVDKLWDAKISCLREFLTVIGIDNTPVDKAERVQSAEVESNNQEISMFRLVRLDTLRQGCAAVNRMYGQPDGERPGVTLWCDFNCDFSSANWAFLNTLGTEEGGTDAAY